MCAYPYAGSRYPACLFYSGPLHRRIRTDRQTVVYKPQEVLSRFILILLMPRTCCSQATRLRPRSFGHLRLVVRQRPVLINQPSRAQHGANFPHMLAQALVDRHRVQNTGSERLLLLRPASVMSGSFRRPAELLVQRLDAPPIFAGGEQPIWPCEAICFRSSHNYEQLASPIAVCLPRGRAVAVTLGELWRTYTPLPILL